MKNFIVLDRLGEGVFGQVFRVRRLIDNQQYALKKVDTRALTEKQIQNALNEVRILASFNDQNIIAYKDAFYEPEYECICLVMELADGGDLQTLICRRMKAKKPFEEKEIWSVAYCLVKALRSLRSRKIIHRDIKSANIFLSGGKAKLGDMNVSKVTKMAYAYSQAGTPYYTSPEVWREEPYSYQSDIWSLGCVLYEMCMGRLPFRTNGGASELAMRIQKGKYQPISTRYSFSLSNFIRGCLIVNVSERVHLDTLMEFAYLFVDNTEKRHVHSFESASDLLKTIIVPDRLEMLNDVLPQPKYNDRPISPNKLHPYVPRIIKVSKSISSKPLLNHSDSSRKLLRVINYSMERPPQIRSAKYIPSPERKHIPRLSLNRIPSNPKLNQSLPKKLIRHGMPPRPPLTIKHENVAPKERKKAILVRYCY